MTIEDFNALVDQAYEAAFAFEQKLIDVYMAAYQRQTDVAAARFASETITAAWTTPIYQSLSDGMNEEEQQQAEDVRNEAALAIAAILAAAGVTVSSPEFLEAINERAQLNFEQEIMRQLRNVVGGAFDAHLSAEETVALIREQIPQIIPSSAEMLAQTELTALVNERSIAAAQKQFPDGAFKRWATVGDARVRVAHAHAEGQTVPVGQPFSVGGAALMFPGDPQGPLRLTARCRCRLSFTDSAGVVSSGAPTLVYMEADAMSEIDYVVMKGIPESDPVQDYMSNVQVLTDENGHVYGWMVPNLDSNSGAGGTTMVPVTTRAGGGGDQIVPMTASNITITVSDGETEAQPEQADGGPWRALLAVEGEPTEDGRMILPGALVWRQPPLSLMALDFTSEGGHQGARVAGRVDRIWRDGNEVWGEGVFNTDEFGAHIEELYNNRSLNGNSIDPAGVTAEIWDRETMTALDAEQVLEAVMEGRELLQVFTRYVIGATTFCPVQAIEAARTEPAITASALTVFYAPWPAEEVLTASAAGMVPLHPPASWFEKPSLCGPTPLTITDEGQVFGHAALWNTCHVGEPNGPGVCVPPPRSGMSYEAFHHGALRTEEGTDVTVGQLTLGTLHAGRDLGWRETIRHYENSGMAFADVRAYEDAYGIVVAGALRPDVPATKVREARAGALSGDWRDVLGRGLEFVAALVVNIAGFPVPRPEARIVASATGEEQVLALVAAGVVPPAEEIEGMSRREYLRTIRALTDDVFRTYTAEQRRRMAENGQALPDGSFPIADCADARNAIQSVGRASDQAAAERHIRKRVRALGCTGSIFDNWK